MQASSAHRGVAVERVPDGKFRAANSRGGQIAFGTGGGADFAPAELLLAAVGCTVIDVDILTCRRAEPEGFLVLAEADKVRDADGGRTIETGMPITAEIE